jgi:hypothetical protein
MVTWMARKGLHAYCKNPQPCCSCSEGFSPHDLYRERVAYVLQGILNRVAASPKDSTSTIYIGKGLHTYYRESSVMLKPQRRIDTKPSGYAASPSQPDCHYALHFVVPLKTSTGHRRFLLHYAITATRSAVSRAYGRQTDQARTDRKFYH